MTDVGLGGVHGLAMVPHVLRGVERLERKPVKEVARVQEAGHGPNGPPGGALQQRGHVLQLRHRPLLKAAPLQRLQVLLARIHRKLTSQIAQHLSPAVNFVVHVLNAQDRLARFVGSGKVADSFSPLLVWLVCETRMVNIEVRAKPQYLSVVHIVDTLRNLQDILRNNTSFDDTASVCLCLISALSEALPEALTERAYRPKRGNFM
eukprot:CAMPEP_0118959308 /NCGR_PEP_ID=MMETSP1169-20130426/63064_1 /TAXON_ID=36882 /ORGANISM="Pyramimonas obovata, Strain CCMP722" /LENGTH=205 /DNA_ID=CAMNT_0006907439 /DNA_START=355 /DNA_END=973 /DNA_ORIENTATION=+